MILLFVHGWSVTNTNTYGDLPQVLPTRAKRAGVDLDVRHMFLGRYISFHDEVTMDDIVRAFHDALADCLPNNADRRKVFSCITHSTGGPLVRCWIDRYYGAAKLEKCPLRHLIMLAPANYGSALAQLGKSRLSRIKSWFQGIEPGQQVLNWLELGSEGQWQLAQEWAKYRLRNSLLYPLVLTGQSIDEKFYDFLNTYLVEKGSDGVVRVAGANANVSIARIQQTRRELPKRGEFEMELDGGNVVSPPPVPLGVVPGASHSGSKMGIMRSVTKKNAGSKPVVPLIVKALRIKNRDQYNAMGRVLDSVTRQTQGQDSRYAMLVFKIVDDAGHPVNDFDLFMLGGPKYSPDKLPPGFFKDRQRNRISPNTLTYFVDADKMLTVEEGKFGVRVVGRPDDGFVKYAPGEFYTDLTIQTQLIVPNQTTIFEIKLRRVIDKEVFRLDSAGKKQGSFKKVKPSGEIQD